MAKSKAKPKPKPRVPAAPTRVIIEVIVKTESGIAARIIQPFAGETSVTEAAVPPNFSYSFELTNMKILHLIVGEMRLDEPPASGSFFARVMDPSDPPKIRMTVVAVASNPGSSGSLSMKYLGKMVFDPAKNIPMRAGRGGFDEIITLPA